MARQPLSEAEIRTQVLASRARAWTAPREEPEVVEASYDAEKGRVVVELANGCAFAFPPALSPELSDATAEQLATVEVIPDGEGLHWEELDVDIAMPGLIARVLNVGALAAKYLGQRTSPAKAAAAHINGQKGGRPHKIGVREETPAHSGVIAGPPEKG